MQRLINCLKKFTVVMNDVSVLIALFGDKMFLVMKTNKPSKKCTMK